MFDPSVNICLAEGSNACTKVRTHFERCHQDVPQIHPGNPAREALSGNFEYIDPMHSRLRQRVTPPFGCAQTHPMNFHLFLQRMSEDKLIWKPTIGSCSNLEPKFRSLGLIRSNLQLVNRLKVRTQMLGRGPFVRTFSPKVWG